MTSSPPPATLTAAKRLARAYVIALIAVAALVILSQALIQFQLQGQEGDAQVMNVAGRQRMLSQRIVKEILRAETGAAPASEAGELAADLLLWETMHRRLRSGEVGFWQAANSADLERLFDDLEPHFQEIAKIARSFLQRPVRAAKSTSAVPGAFSAALRSPERQYLTLMNEIVFAYEREARARVVRLQVVELVLAGLAILVLLAAALLLFRPITRQVRETIAELNIARGAAEELSRTDSLTGIANRRRFDQEFEREVRRCARRGEPIAVIMLDLDHFKELNDRMGHQAGDECLARVARALSEQLLRPGDLVARYGGDEFVVYLPETDLERARLVAARLEQAVASLHIVADDDGQDVSSVGVSFGIAAAVPAGAPNAADNLVKEADLALYHHKLAKHSVSGQVRILRSVAPSPGRAP